MKQDLWGFKDAGDLKKRTENMPDSILKEQIDLLGEKTNFVIYGKPVYMKVNADEINYKYATMFNVVVPALDNYEKTLLIMYSNPENEYPVAITTDSSYEEDCEWFDSKYVCKNKESFERTIKKILSSDKIMNIIEMLYSKAAMISTT